MKPTWSIVLLLLLFMPVIDLNAAAEDLVEVRTALMCTCPDCSMVLVSCECGTADQMNASIAKMLDDGMTKAQVIQAYVDRYGEVILSAPPAEGFNLLSWIIPFATLALGVLLVLATIQRWTTPAPTTVAILTSDGPLDEELMARMQREMNELGI
ncbi:MAG: cytochrome c-type biogenesis protein CcmH [Candidatus Neomarinimicrobiota bacterium]